MISGKIFREYDVRGVVDVDLNSEVATCIGKAFAVLLKKFKSGPLKVSVGKDVRNSSSDLAAGIISGILHEGVDVVDIGICPTPLQYFSIFHLDLDGGIMVTGSHNPPEYNGFKISIGRETIHGDGIQALKEIIISEEFSKDAEPGNLTKFDIVQTYISYMLNEFSYLGGPEFRRLKVVVDSGNGTAGSVAPEIITRMGCDVVRLYCEPDGNFPNHHPDPTVIENVRDLIAQTKKTYSDIGIAYDGDADRIGVVNRNGEIVWGDQLMIVLSRELLKKNSGAKIIGDVKCSQLMFDDIQANGGIPIMWKTGHSLIKQKMKNEKALIAGEFSGHIFIADRYYGFDDAIYTTLRLIEIMKLLGKDISELLADIPKLYYTPEIRIDCPEEKKKSAVEKIVKKIIDYKDSGKSPYPIVNIDTTDGVRLVFEDGWGLVRTSNTQPVVVMRVEAKNEQSMINYRAFLEEEFREAMQ